MQSEILAVMEAFKPRCTLIGAVPWCKSLVMKNLRILFILLVAAVPVMAQDVRSVTRDHLVIVGTDGKRYDFAIELALTPEQQTQGLMYRRSLAADGGMLFDFHQTKSISMWMKNTFIPLDMIFITDDGTVAGIAQRAIPQSLDIISSPGPVRAVLEVNGGTADRLHLHAGDRVLYKAFAAAN